jgi:hypothetical protein
VLLGGNAATFELRNGQGRLIKDLSKPTTRFSDFSTCLMPNGSIALIGTGEGEVQLWRLPDASTEPRSAEEHAKVDFPKRLVLDVYLSEAEVKGATGGAEDPFSDANYLKLAPLLRAQVRRKAIELGASPTNIGLPHGHEAREFKRDGAGYRGRVTFDFYK